MWITPLIVSDISASKNFGLGVDAYASMCDKEPTEAMVLRGFKEGTMNYAAWAESHETHIAVATAIHAIADDRRSADEIWEAPTPAEVKRVKKMVADSVKAGTFPREPDGRYYWGEYMIVI